MSKGLEALKHIGEYHIGEKKYGYDIKETAIYGVVEKELKALEILKEVGGVAWERILKVWLKIEKINDEKYDLLKEALS